MGIVAFAVWGLMGAFVYAAPRLVVSLSDARPDRKTWLPWAEFAVAILTGPIGAAGFSDLVASAVHQTKPADLRAVALVIGMVANPMAPAIVHLVGDNILRRLSAPLKPINPRKPS